MSKKASNPGPPKGVKPKITPMPPLKKAGMSATLAALRYDLPVLIEAQASCAMLLRARFEALVKTGFSEAQALELVKERGLEM